MANSLVIYEGDGTTKQYDIGFGYLRREDIFVLVDGGLYPFTWIDENRIELLPEDPPLEGQQIMIRRITDRNARITDFKDGQTLLAGDLDASALQNFYLIQEMLDSLTEQLVDGVNVVSGAGDIELFVANTIDEAVTNSPVLANFTQEAAQATQDRLDAIVLGLQQTTDGITSDVRATSISLQQSSAELDVSLADLRGELEALVVQFSNSDESIVAQIIANEETRRTRRSHTHRRVTGCNH